MKFLCFDFILCLKFFFCEIRTDWNFLNSFFLSLVKIMAGGGNEPSMGSVSKKFFWEIFKQVLKIVKSVTAHTSVKFSMWFVTEYVTG